MVRTNTLLHAFLFLFISYPLSTVFKAPGANWTLQELSLTRFYFWYCSKPGAASSMLLESHLQLVEPPTWTMLALTPVEVMEHFPWAPCSFLWVLRLSLGCVDLEAFNKTLITFELIWSCKPSIEKKELKQSPFNFFLPHMYWIIIAFNYNLINLNSNCDGYTLC